MLPNQTQRPPALMTVEALAARLDVSKRTIWRWVKDGRLPQPIRFTKTCCRFRSEEVEAALERLSARTRVDQAGQ